MDFWAQRCLAEVSEAAEAGVPPPVHTGDRAMADTIMDFLFASQDASTASLCWLLTLMADHPEVLAKVRAAFRFARPAGCSCVRSLSRAYRRCLAPGGAWLGTRLRCA